MTIESITIGQVAIALSFIVTVGGGVAYLHRNLKAMIKGAVTEDFTKLNNKIDELQWCINKTDLEKTKNFIVARLGELERGEKLDDVEIQRLFEQYEHYIKHGGNSYIEQKFEKLQKDGKL